MAIKIISGGQNGVDQAALRAAKACGLETGGTAPKGYLTLDGPSCSLGRVFGLVESKSPKYPPRTYANVRDAEFTLQLVSVYAQFSRGEICTGKAIDKHRRPSLMVIVDLDNEERTNFSPREVADYLRPYKIVNVAGNSEKSAPGIGRWAESFLLDVFRSLCDKKGA